MTLPERPLNLPRPMRVRLAGRINGVLTWMVRRAPKPLHIWLLGPGTPWDNRCDRWIGATVCRALGHDWRVCSPGANTTAALLMCDGCGWLWATDDWDPAFAETREGRDQLAIVALDYLTALENRHEMWVLRARRLVSRAVDEVACSGPSTDPCLRCQMRRSLGLPSEHVYPHSASA